MDKAMVAKKGFTFGADPELFVVDGNGKLVTAAGLIPGTKEEPHPVERGAVQVDGMAAEFNIDPASTFKDFNDSIEAVMKQLKGFLPVGYDFLIVPSVRFDPEVFDKAPDEAKELGCNPDFNAWTGDVNPPPSAPDDPYLRTASGHIHIGWGEDFENDDVQHILNCCDMVKQLDWFLGAWSVEMDSDPIRRKLYGKAGAYRPKPYGVEYRVLSNFWISQEATRLMVWNRLQAAVEDMQQAFLPDNLGSVWNDRLINAVNTSKFDRELADSLSYPVRTVDRNYDPFTVRKKGMKLSQTDAYFQAAPQQFTTTLNAGIGGGLNG